MNHFLIPDVFLATGEFWQFYADNLRGNLFGGFLTVATFLFAVKTFLIVTLHKDVYSNPSYQRFRAQVQREGISKDSPIAPLRRLSMRLFWSTVLAFLAAATQMTVGLYPSSITASICCSIAAISLIDLLCVLLIQRGVIHDWLDAIEREANQPDAVKTEKSEKPLEQ